MMGDGSSPPTANPLGTGVEGFDDILNGGLPAGHVYMVSGAPGTGKTTLGLQFLLAGRAAEGGWLVSPDSLLGSCVSPTSLAHELVRR